MDALLEKETIISPMPSMFDLTDRVTVVTGASGVLGKSFCEAIGQAGGIIVLADRNREAGLEREEALREQGYEALFVPTDVLDEAQLAKTCQTVLTHYGRIDNLVNAAGGNIPDAVVAPDADLFSVNVAALKRALDLNLYGTVIPTLAFGRAMAERGGTRPDRTRPDRTRPGGSIVNISSMTAQTAVTRVLGYSMAKAGVDNFTRWMAVELAQRYGDRLRVNAIAPGFFITHQNRALLTQPDGSYTERGQAVIRNTPFQRFGEPDELVGTLLWLLSDASRFVTGEVVCVDGGFHVFSGV